MSRAPLPRRGRALGCSGGWIGLLGAALVLSAKVVSAGSIFMENGYIIQGPIVEYDDDKVVLGWTNGKVTVYRRFIESVSYDPGEKEKIDELRRQMAREVVLSEQPVAFDSTAEDIDDLPADLEVFLRLYGGPVRRPADPENGPETGPAPDGGPDVAVEPQPQPQPLGERVFSPERDFSLLPPAGWEVKQIQAGVMAAERGVSASGAGASFNMVRLPEGLSLEDAATRLGAEQRAALENHEILSEGMRPMSSGEEAFEIVARGSLDGRTLVLRQVLVEHQDRLWLFSGFSEGMANDASFALIEEALNTLEFSRN